jgi:large subunit ribosomal protein L9
VRVFLLRDLPGVGKKGSEVDVSDGYARNYLIPKGLALEARPGLLRSEEERRRASSERERREEERARSIAERISGKVVEVRVEVGEGGKMFGSVTSQWIADVLASEGITIDKKCIELEGPIKSLGDHRVRIRLHPKVSCELIVSVVGDRR